MLSTEDNELLCRVGPGTPMGEFMREYWLPAFVPSELPEADGAPMRLRLLGEDLIAFRVTSGKFGLIAHNCPHRGASLFFGRNEEEGIRCVYHGWKFDVGGNCVDMPNEPAESDFNTKVTSRRVSDARAQRHRVGVHGAARDAAAAARVAAQPRARLPGVDATAGIELVAGARRRHRHRARLLPALGPSADRANAQGQRRLLHHAAALRALRRAGPRRRLELRRGAPGGAGHRVLAHGPLPDAVLHDERAGPARHQEPVAGLGAARRPQHDGVDGRSPGAAGARDRDHRRLQGRLRATGSTRQARPVRGPKWEWGPAAEVRDRPTIGSVGSVRSRTWTTTT